MSVIEERTLRFTNCTGEPGVGPASTRASLQLYVMTEIPSNAIVAEDFAERFDGLSTGSNDLTQFHPYIDFMSVTLHSFLAVKQNVAAAELDEVSA